MSASLPDLDWYATFLHASSPAAILDRQLVLVACNLAYENAVGKRREQLLGRNFFDVFPGMNAAQQGPIRASCEHVWTHRSTHAIELVSYHLDESRRYWSVVNTPLLDDGGEVRYLLTQPTNVTEITRFRNALSPLVPRMDGDDPLGERLNVQEVQQILSAQRRRLEQLFQQAPGFVCILSGPRHVYDMANDAYYQLVGYREIIGHELSEVLPEVVPQGFLDKLNSVYATGIPFIGRAIPIDLQRTPDAPLETVHVDLMYQPIRDDAGQITGIFVQGHDVSEAYRLSREVAYQAAHDPLTGLANRGMLDEAGLMLERGGSHVLLYLDLDHFKIVNDRCGHHAGDELLSQVAEILDRRTRPEDLLARLLDEQGKPIPPGAFIPAAERFGIVEQLDYHIVRKAFEVLKVLPSTMRAPLFFVNLSGATLSSQDFASSLLRIAGHYPDVLPGNICFEVTETSAITNLGRAADAMQHLVDAGFSFALDDFGSGMSSFSYLERLPVRYVKIDGEFIRNMGAHVAGEAIVESVARVAKAMGIVTIAEHIEQLDQVPLLRSLGVDLGQGFGLHRPEPVEPLLRGICGES